MTFSRQAGRSRVLPRDKNHERKGRSGGREKLERDGTPRGEQNLIACEHRTIYTNARAVLRARCCFARPRRGCKIARHLRRLSLSPSFLLASRGWKVIGTRDRGKFSLSLPLKVEVNMFEAGVSADPRFLKFLFGRSVTRFDFRNKEQISEKNFNRWKWNGFSFYCYFIDILNFSRNIASFCSRKKNFDYRV